MDDEEYCPSCDSKPCIWKRWGRTCSTVFTMDDEKYCAVCNSKPCKLKKWGSRCATGRYRENGAEVTNVNTNTIETKVNFEGGSEDDDKHDRRSTRRSPRKAQGDSKNSNSKEEDKRENDRKFTGTERPWIYLDQELLDRNGQDSGLRHRKHKENERKDDEKFSKKSQRNAEKDSQNSEEDGKKKPYKKPTDRNGQDSGHGHRKHKENERKNDEKSSKKSQRNAEKDSQNSEGNGKEKPYKKPTGTGTESKESGFSMDGSSATDLLNGILKLDLFYKPKSGNVYGLHGFHNIFSKQSNASISYKNDNMACAAGMNLDRTSVNCSVGIDKLNCNMDLDFKNRKFEVNGKFQNFGCGLSLQDNADDLCVKGGISYSLPFESVGCSFGLGLSRKSGGFIESNVSLMGFNVVSLDTRESFFPKFHVPPIQNLFPAILDFVMMFWNWSS